MIITSSIQLLTQMNSVSDKTMMLFILSILIFSDIVGCVTNTDDKSVCPDLKFLAQNNKDSVCEEMKNNRSMHLTDSEDQNKCYQNFYPNSDNSNSKAFKGHFKPFGESGVNIPIQEVSGFPDNLLLDYVLPSIPVLMKGAAKLSPIFDKFATDEYLLQLASIDATRRFKVSIEHGKKENRGGKLGLMTFKTFLKTYNKSDIYLITDVDTLPFLESILMMPCPLQCPQMSSVPMKSVMWFSSGGTKSVVHLDEIENINCLYRGNKYLIFLDPDQIGYDIDSLLDSKGGDYSKIDVDYADLNLYPFLRGLEFITATMEAGDCLYIPEGWIHQVRSSGSNLAVNVWFEQRDTLQLLKDGYCKGQDFVCDPTFTLSRVKHPPIAVG